eukprot:symbB.v1.2.009672.t1/scaffold589.1/size183863/7
MGSSKADGPVGRQTRTKSIAVSDRGIWEGLLTEAAIAFRAPDTKVLCMGRSGIGKRSLLQALHQYACPLAASTEAAMKTGAEHSRAVGLEFAHFAPRCQPMSSLFDGQRGVVLVTCLGAYFLSMAMIYQMSPFFQLYAQETCGASTSTVGLIFAVMPSACFIGNLAMGSMINRFGVEVMLNSGLVLLAVSSLGFGLSNSVEGWMFWRSLQGLATAPIYTSISTRLARTFTGNGEFNRVVGLQEVFGNVGVTIGPFLGGVLFEYGGFLLPFAVSAGLHLLFVGISFCGRTPTGSGSEPLMEGSELEEDSSVTVASVSTLRLLLLSGIGALCLGVWGGFEPLLGDHFIQVLGPISQSLIGFLMHYVNLIGDWSEPRQRRVP